MRLSSFRVSLAAFAAGLTLVGCTQFETTNSADRSAHYPITVMNCGAEVTFEAPPRRVVMLKSAPVTALQSIGVLDRTVARAGAFSDQYFDRETLAVLDSIPQLAGDVDSSGHLQISADAVIAQAPDLLLGEVENLSREQMEALDIPLIEEPAFCSTSSDKAPTWDSVYDQVRVYGNIFDRRAAADKAIDKLETRVKEARKKVHPEENRSAAVLYPTVGGGTIYAYGTGSMAHPQLEAAGFTNVFENVSERVFEVSIEEIIGRNPDVLILLHSDGDAAAVEQTLIDMPGSHEISAIRNDEVMTHLLNFTEPATPLAVDGLERIVERFYQ